MDNFELLHNIQAYGQIPISEYRSKKTGLTVFIAETDGPINTALCALAKESFDDNAIIPSILRHLIYMGSQEHPYKDFLSTLAKPFKFFKFYPFTTIDHTSYLFNYIGSENFLTVLPVFVDHILFPELNEAGYITEIHHITEQGEDDGVLYGQIGKFENSPEILLDLAVMKHIYPGRCGYSFAYTGNMNTFRESMNIDKVRKYHKEFYQPENLKIIIIGSVEHRAVFKSLEKIEEKITSQGDRRPFQRLWQNIVPPMIEDDKDLTIFYPSDEETTGTVCMAWRGPSSVIELYDLLATSFLLIYLTDFSFSPMKKIFVIDEQYAHDVFHFIQEGVESCIMIKFKGVPLNKLSEMKLKLKTSFKNIVNNKSIDMDDLRNAINKYKLASLSRLENQKVPETHLGREIIYHMLYGNTKDDFQQRLNPLTDMTRLLEEPQSFWLNLLQKYFVENKHVVVQCLPSNEEKLRIEKMEEERIEAQKQKLTDDELREKGAILEKAIECNERKFTPDLLHSFPSLSLASITLRVVCRYSSEKSENERIDLSPTPVFTYFDHIKTNFVYMYAILDTFNIPRELVNYLYLLREIILELPIQQEECLVHHEDVKKKLENDTTYTKVVLYNFGFKFVLHLKVEDAKYEYGVKWLRDLLYNTVFTAERLKVAAKRIMDFLQDDQRYERTQLNDIMDEMCYPSDNRAKNTSLQKIRFISEVIKKMETDRGGFEILENINKLKKIITEPSNVALYFAGNLDYLKNPVKAINEFLPAYLQHAKSQQRVTPRHGYKFLNFSNSINGCIVGHTSLERSLFFQKTKSLTSYNDSDYIALDLYLNYINKYILEDKLETYIRNSVAYGFVIDIMVEQGILKLYYSTNANIVEVYAAVKEKVMNQIESKKWDITLLESARNSVSFGKIYGENSISDIVQMSLSSYIYDYDFEKYRNNVKLLSNVTVEDLNRVAKKYVVPLFDPTKTKTVVITNSSKTVEFIKKFKQLGFDMKIYSTTNSLLK